MLVRSFAMQRDHFEFTPFGCLDRLSISFGMNLFKLDSDELDL